MSMLKTAAAAAFLEVAATSFLADFVNGTAQVMMYLALHLVASILLASAVMPVLPERYREPHQWVAALLFSFAFFMPLLGIIGILSAIVITPLLTLVKKEDPFSGVRAPEYVLSIRDPDIQFRIAGLRATLLDPNLPSELRMRSLIALQNMPTRVAAPTLRKLLGDSADDIRLVAYGILDQKEKIINTQILGHLESLDRLLDRDGRINALRQLAELNWELVYTGLVQGDVREHTLNQVVKYTEEALQLSNTTSVRWISMVVKYTEEALQLSDNIPGLWLLRGRALHAQRKLDLASTAYARAISNGLAESRALPYLAEVAYDRHDFRALREYVARLARNSQPTPMMGPVLRYWSAANGVRR